MEIKTYQFNLYDAQDGSLVMGTEVDEIPEPKIDAEFWQRFLRGDCAMIFMGEKTEEIDDELSSGPTSHKPKKWDSIFFAVLYRTAFAIRL